MRRRMDSHYIIIDVFIMYGKKQGTLHIYDERSETRARAFHRTDQRFLAYSAFDSVQKLQLYTEMFWTTPDVFMYVYMHACMHVCMCI